MHCVCMAKFKIMTAVLAAILIFVFILFYLFIYLFILVQKILARSFRLLTQIA